eukprot:scaffold5052_cov30-Tisochrysis_lutea.AAC.2
MSNSRFCICGIFELVLRWGGKNLTVSLFVVLIRGMFQIILPGSWRWGAGQLLANPRLSVKRYLSRGVRAPPSLTTGLTALRL